MRVCLCTCSAAEGSIAGSLRCVLLGHVSIFAVKCNMLPNELCLQGCVVGLLLRVLSRARCNPRNMFAFGHSFVFFGVVPSVCLRVLCIESRVI